MIHTSKSSEAIWKLCVKNKTLFIKSLNIWHWMRKVLSSVDILKLNQIWLIIDERYKVIELNLNKHWTGLSNDTVVFLSCFRE